MRSIILVVMYYITHNYSRAIKYYHKALTDAGMDSGQFPTRILAPRCFAHKQYDKASAEYMRALQT